ncbi:O-antigen ligase family protein [Microbacterium sp. GXF7504]
MAVHTQHPAWPVPTAPERERTAHLLLRAWCVFVLFLGVTGVAWVLAFGAVAAGAVAITAGIVSSVVWLVVRPPLNGRRLPWFVLAYVLWAGLSVLWSAWPGATVPTWLLLAVTTLQGLFVAAVLTWRELVASIASALKWALGLSLVFELAVSLFVQAPLLPGFRLRAPDATYDPIEYWSRDNLFDGGRIQGLFGNANLLAAVAVLALIVFAVRFAAGAPRRVLLVGWMLLAVFLLVRAGSATAYLSALAVLVVLGTVLLMRTVEHAGGRTKYYLLYALVGLGGAAALWFGRDAIFTALGRSADLTGRERIWDAVLERASQHPVVGWGYSTPWLTSDPAFDGWIVDHGVSVQQAHNMWLDVFLQLGAVGLVLVVGIYLSFIWRSWFFAIDRPRWDLRADRPYSPLTLLPTLLATLLLVQGVTESGPLLLWGWMLVVALGTKITQAPLVGVGPAEQSVALERGDAVTGP